MLQGSGWAVSQSHLPCLEGNKRLQERAYRQTRTKSNDWSVQRPIQEGRSLQMHRGRHAPIVRSRGSLEDRRMSSTVMGDGNKLPEWWNCSLHSQQRSSSKTIAGKLTAW